MNVPNLASPEWVSNASRHLDSIRELTASGHKEARHRQLWQNPEIIRHYLFSFLLAGSGNDFIKAYVNDALARFLLTLDRLPLTPRLKVLELGANPYLFTTLLKRFHDYELTLTNFFDKNIYAKEIGSGQQRIVSDAFSEDHTYKYDLVNIELSEYPYPEGHFDVVLFCEIMEHLVVDPLSVLPKLLRIIKPGGLLILTTPNAVRLINFANMVAGSNIFDRYCPANGVYGRHNREFTVEELDILARGAGFEIESIETLDRYDYNQPCMAKDSYEKPQAFPYTRPQLLEMMNRIGADTRNRGDNIYLVARRPMQS